MIAARLLLEENKGPTEVARLLGVSRSAVQQWKRKLRRKGRDGLKSKAHPGAKPRLSRQQRRRLVRILGRGARKAGYLTDLGRVGVCVLARNSSGIVWVDFV